MYNHWTPFGIILPFHLNLFVNLCIEAELVQLKQLCPICTLCPQQLTSFSRAALTYSGSRLAFLGSIQLLFSPRAKNIQFNEPSNIHPGVCPAMGKIAPEYKIPALKNFFLWWSSPVKVRSGDCTAMASWCAPTKFFLINSLETSILRTGLLEERSTESWKGWKIFPSFPSVWCVFITAHNFDIENIQSTAVLLIATAPVPAAINWGSHWTN